MGEWEVWGWFSSLLPASLSACGICSEKSGEVAAWWLGCVSSPQQLDAAASDTLSVSWDLGVAEHILPPQSSRFTVHGWLSRSFWVVLQVQKAARLSDQALLFIIYKSACVWESILVTIVSPLSFDVESGCTFPVLKGLSSRPKIATESISQHVQHFQALKPTT